MTELNNACAQRRENLAKAMQQNGGGVAVLFSGREIMRNRDADFPFRWDSYFYYLTGFTEPDAALVLIADAAGHQSVLFCREKNPERETWDGFRWGPDAARETFGFDQAHTIGELDAQMSTALADKTAIYYQLGVGEAIDTRVRGWLESVRAQARAGITSPAQAHDLNALLDDMRLVKDGYELDVMRRAADISADAHQRAMRVCRPGMHEYEVEAELLHEFRRRGSQYPAYGSIVASGANACVLHYRANDAAMKDGDLLLIDAGCELDSYASDITRTFPVNGHFSKGQRELYEIVLASQQAAVDATRPGNHFNQPHDAALRVLVQGMIDTGLLAGELDELIEDGSYRRYYMHRTSHWLGMDVHDCGDYRERAEHGNGNIASDGPDDTEPAWRILQPGMVLTIEPGIYVNAAADVPEMYRDIGIRIEDDAVVNAKGCEIITSGVPKTVNEIEKLMQD